MIDNSHRYCVIMCGGVGSRFWPYSRKARPKQFIDFFGTGRSMLQMTYDRVRQLVNPANVVIMTNSEYSGLVREQLPEVLPENILCEPSRRNTAPSIYWASRHIAARDPEASVVVLPSDHVILREIAFIEALSAGLTFVEENDALLTLGICPTSPKTGYGYIQKGSEVAGYEGIMKVKAFTEKPELEMAKVFLRSGEFFWNSGIFLWRVKTILDAFGKYDPEIVATLSPADGENVYGTPAEIPFIDTNFPNSPCISVDYAIMEKASNVYVKTVNIGWSDLGTWKALHEISPKDSAGNVSQNCRVIARDCEGSVFAASGDRLIVAYGLKDYIVADEGNALLICPMDDEQKLRQTVNEVTDLFGEEYI